MENDATRKFQEAWGRIVSGDLDHIDDGFKTLLYATYDVDMNRVAREIIRSDLIVTSLRLSEYTLSSTALFYFVHLLYRLSRSGDYFCQKDAIIKSGILEASAKWVMSTDRHIRRSALMLWATFDIMRLSYNVPRSPFQKVAVEALVFLFRNFKHESLETKKEICAASVRIVRVDEAEKPKITLASCVLRELETAWRDPDMREYVPDLLNVASYVIDGLLNQFDGSEPLTDMSFMLPQYFEAIFHYLNNEETVSCSAPIIYKLIESRNDLEHIALKPRALESFRLLFANPNPIFPRYWILIMWSLLELARGNPNTALAMMRSDFLGDTLTHIVRSPSFIKKEGHYVFMNLVYLISYMQDASKEDTAQYFASRSFFKLLAAATKAELFPISIGWRDEIPIYHATLRRVLHDFACAAPPTLHVDATVAAAVKDTSVSSVVRDHTSPDWGSGAVPITDIAAFAAASGNVYCAALLEELLTPSPGDDGLTHAQRWRWLIKPNELCKAVLHHFLHISTEAKERLLAAADLSSSFHIRTT